MVRFFCGHNAHKSSLRNADEEGDSKALRAAVKEHSRGARHATRGAATVALQQQAQLLSLQLSEFRREREMHDS